MERCSPVEARVPAWFAGEAALVRLRRGYNGFQMTAMTRR
jgi:hypothetical protein